MEHLLKCSFFDNIFKTIEMKKKIFLEYIWKFELFIENDTMFLI